MKLKNIFNTIHQVHQLTKEEAYERLLNRRSEINEQIRSGQI